MRTPKVKVKYSKYFNGESGSVFTIRFDRLKELLEYHNDFKVEGFVVTKDGIDVFIDKSLSVGTDIKIQGFIN